MFSSMFREKEKTVEKKIIAYAKGKGWRNHKWTSPGKRGPTDQFFTKSPSRIVFMEVKRDEDEEPTPQQVREQRLLREEGFPVFTVKSFEEARAIFDAL